MKISILTLFPEMFESPFKYSILKRAQEKKLAEIEYINIRDFGIGRHKIVDDKPYGGGAGMLLRVDVLDKAIQKSRCFRDCKEQVVLLDPSGILFSQKKAIEFTSFDHLILICGRYEGFDHRVRSLVDAELSIGDYVLTGGELPAMAVTDAVVRLLPKVLGKSKSSEVESFREKILEYPQYTRPKEFNGLEVPQVLLLGNHEKIQEWRKKEALKRTKEKRPDLLK